MQIFKSKSRNKCNLDSTVISVLDISLMLNPKKFENLYNFGSILFWPLLLKKGDYFLITLLMLFQELGICKTVQYHEIWPFFAKEKLWIWNTLYSFSLGLNVIYICMWYILRFPVSRVTNTPSVVITSI